MYFGEFKENIRLFLINLLEDPSNIVIENQEFKDEYNITPPKLLEILLNRGITQQIDDHEFVVPRLNYERKIERLYVLMSGRKSKINTLVEDEGMGGDVGGATSASAVNNSAPIGKLSFIKK